MKKNSTKFIIGGILLLLATTSFAAVLDYYVKAQGTAQVSPPEFYIGSPLEEKLLIVNEKSSNCESFEIESEYRTFKTKNLEGVSFNYVPQSKFFVRAKVATTTPQDLILSFGYYNTSDSGESNPQYLCSQNIPLTQSMDDCTTQFIQCSEAPTNIRRFFYEFKKGCMNCDYTISKCDGIFYTKVELSK